MSERRSAERGEWVQIHVIVLEPGARAPQVPPETQGVPLEMWAKGFLVSGRAAIGENAEIETVTGRRLSGELSAVEPAHEHGFGEPVPELLSIGSEARKLLGREAYAWSAVSSRDCRDLDSRKRGCRDHHSPDGDPAVPGAGGVAG